MPLPDAIIEVLTTFRPLFTAPTWRNLMTLLTGTLLAQGRRTVTAVLRSTGNAIAGNWSNFHSVAQPSMMVSAGVSRQLLLLIVETFVPAGASVDLALCLFAGFSRVILLANVPQKRSFILIQLRRQSRS